MFSFKGNKIAVFPSGRELSSPRSDAGYLGGVQILVSRDIPPDVTRYCTDNSIAWIDLEEGTMSGRTDIPAAGVFQGFVADYGIRLAR